MRRCICCGQDFIRPVGLPMRNACPECFAEAARRGMRLCTGTNHQGPRILPLDQFYPHKTRGHQSQCKTCCNGGRTPVPRHPAPAPVSVDFQRAAQQLEENRRHRMAIDLIFGRRVG